MLLRQNKLRIKLLNMRWLTFFSKCTSLTNCILFSTIFKWISDEMRGFGKRPWVTVWKKWCWCTDWCRALGGQRILHLNIIDVKKARGRRWECGDGSVIHFETVVLITMQRIPIIYILLGNGQCTSQPPLQHQATYLHSLFRYHWYRHNGTNSVVALVWNRKRGRSVPWYQCYRRNRRAVSERCPCSLNSHNSIPAY
jgi:hypothetical protein